MVAHGEEETGMEKYGVDETTPVRGEDLEKLAAKGCPSCGREVIRHGSVLMCPVHGTEPFERSKNGS